MARPPSHCVLMVCFCLQLVCLRSGVVAHHALARWLRARPLARQTSRVRVGAVCLRHPQLCICVPVQCWNPAHHRLRLQADDGAVSGSNIHAVTTKRRRSYDTSLHGEHAQGFLFQQLTSNNAWLPILMANFVPTVNIPCWLENYYTTKNPVFCD